jgi:hypothetical protein
MYLVFKLSLTWYLSVFYISGVFDILQSPCLVGVVDCLFLLLLNKIGLGVTEVGVFDSLGFLC